MGGSESKIKYSVPVTQPNKGETAVYRRASYKDKLTDTLDGYSTLQQIYSTRFKENSSEPLLGHRKTNPQGLATGSYQWETWGEVEALVKAIGSGIINLGLTEPKSQFRDYSLKFVSIYSKNTREWILVDTTNIMYGFTTIPIYDTLGEQATKHMFNETELSTVFLTCNHVKGVTEMLKSKELKFLKNLVILDPVNLSKEVKGQLAGLQYLTLGEVIEAGRAELHEYPNTKPEDVVFFSYTSGTTGVPKGVMINNVNITSLLAGAIEVIPMERGYTHLSYLPLAHILERIVLLCLVYLEGKIGVYSGNPRNIKEDLCHLKPDFFVSVPRLFNKFYDAIQAELKKSTGVKGFIVNKAIDSKNYYYSQSGSYSNSIWDSVVFGQMKAILGGKVKFMMTASAPISKEVQQFMKLVFCCPFMEGYGITEGLAGQFITNPEDPELGHVGGPLPHLEFKLVDVPEMNYFSTDRDEEGRLAPRGEILTRGKCVILSYYKNEELTAEMIDEDGWLRSGDIGMILPESGALKIIDRRKNIFKLPIGEYIAPDKLQQIYKTVEGITDMFVYGDSLKSCIIAIIYSEERALRAIALRLGVEGSYGELCENYRINDYFLKALLDKMREERLKGFEKIKRIALCEKSFEELGLLTTTFKIIRHEAKKHFKPVIDQLYQGLA